MSDLHIFKAQIGMFDPIALQDQNVIIHYALKAHYRKVDFLEAIPPFQAINLGALAAQTVSARTLLTNLEVGDDEFGLYRWYPEDNAQIRIFLPAAVGKHILRNIQVPIDYKTMQRDPNLVSTEIAVWQDNEPAIEAINGMDYALAAVRIVALGYRFHTVKLDEGTIQKIKSGVEKATHVWCTGLAASESVS